MSMKVTPVFGHGPGEHIPTRRKAGTGDMFQAARDDELRAQFMYRCRAVQDFLRGGRVDPDVTAFELNHLGSNLGGDQFDQAIDAPPMRRSFDRRLDRSVIR